MNLIPVFKTNLLWAHMELELDVLGVQRKLVKYVVNSFKRENWKKFIYLHTSCPNSNQPIFVKLEENAYNFVQPCSPDYNVGNGYDYLPKFHIEPPSTNLKVKPNSCKAEKTMKLYCAVPITQYTPTSVCSCAFFSRTSWPLLRGRQYHSEQSHNPIIKYHESKTVQNSLRSR